jgi:Tfp pilus assembly protein PilF
MPTTRSAFDPSWITLAGVLAVLLAYSPAVAGFFFADDETYVRDNVTLRSIPLSRPWELVTSRTNPQEYLPVRDLSYRIDMALFGSDPVGYHLHNLLLYALCCLAAWHAAQALLRILDGRGERPSLGHPPSRARSFRPWAAALATLLFAVHPAHVEAVAWISGRKDLLAGLFSILALDQFARAILPERPIAFRLVLSNLCFALAVLSKSAVVALPGALALLALARFHRPEAPWASGARAIPLVLPALLIGVGAVALHATVGESTRIGLSGEGGELSSLGVSLDRAIRVLGGHAAIALAPVEPRLTYGLYAPGSPGAAAALLGIACVVGGAVAAVQTVRRRSTLAFGLAFFPVMLLPVLQLLPFTTWSMLSDRFVFLPVLGVALAVAVVLSRREPRIRAGVAGLLVIAGLGGTAVRALHWSSEERLWTTNAEASPRYHYAQFLLIDELLLPGVRLEEAAATASRVAHERARGDLQAYVRLHAAFLSPSTPGNHAAVTALEGFVARLRQSQEAADPRDVAHHLLVRRLNENAATYYMTLLRREPDNAGLRFNLGLLLSRLGMREVAALSFRRAAGSDAFDAVNRARAWYQLGLTLRQLDRDDEAVEAFEKAMATDPRQWRAAYQLAVLLHERGDHTRSRAVLHEFRDRALRAGVPTETVGQLVAEAAR